MQLKLFLRKTRTIQSFIYSKLRIVKSKGQWRNWALKLENLWINRNQIWFMIYAVLRKWREFLYKTCWRQLCYCDHTALSIRTFECASILFVWFAAKLLNEGLRFLPPSIYMGLCVCFSTWRYSSIVDENRLSSKWLTFTRIIVWYGSKLSGSGRAWRTKEVVSITDWYVYGALWLWRNPPRLRNRSDFLRKTSISFKTL